jgi:3'-phosphoadenosine 5'-phosphosulfate sulfotransferase (PAPS reductase)/FAD synthetase
VITVPKKIRELIPIVSMSGGKDSTATSLALTEAGIDHRRVYADTGWEHESTYEHLDVLREHLGPIDVVGVEGGMIAKMRARAGFPSRLRRWCTRELKIEPLTAYHDAIRDAEGDTVSVVGIRADESRSRSKMSAFEDDDTWGGYMWRPIIDWSVRDVIDIHHRHGVPMHPLYLRGMSRVGCWPCVFARAKTEIRMTADIDPARIDLIRSLEKEFVQLRRQRNAIQPGRYPNPEAACFFLPIVPGKINTIDEVVAWSRTGYGGKQLPFPPPPSGGCFKWGLCEPPTKEDTP